MFFLGVSSEKKSDTTFFAIIEKTQKNVKKQYQVLEIISFSNGSMEAEEKVTDFYYNKDYIMSKRIFSQDKRPAKRVNAHPKIFIASLANKDKELIKSLRSKKIPVEGFSLINGDIWQKKKADIGLGDNYHVPFNDLMGCLADLLHQKRLEFSKKVLYEKKIYEALKKNNSGNAQANLREPEYKNIILTISIPLWFRENIRYSKRYAMSSGKRMSQV